VEITADRVVTIHYTLKDDGGAVLDSSADGYGTRDDSLIQRVTRRSLQGAGTVKMGMQFQARTDGGPGGHHH
jgi:FKBP-type peptidyl-prolyl cis-trans isomerase 2